MKSVLICPSDHLNVRLLAVDTPLAAVPALGQAVVEYWMSHLACSGVKQVLVLASDRADEVRKLVGDGSRWGVVAEVLEEARELTPEQAAAKYTAQASVMDHFPGLPSHPLFAGYSQWFAALEAWMPLAKTPDRVGMRELRPGVWAGLHGHISSKATLRAPCWLGDHVYVGPGAMVGPRVILERGAFVEPDAEIESSVVGPATFVGRYVRVKDSLAWGGTLVHLQTGLENKVSDAFVLCSLHRPHSQAKPIGFLDRVSELFSRWMEDEPIEQAPQLVKRGS
jgi:NDP-sugar pyrophosphorylase family protein